MSKTWGFHESNAARVRTFLDSLDRRQSDDVQYRIDGGQVVALLVMVGVCIFFWVGVATLIVHTLS